MPERKRVVIIDDDGEFLEEFKEALPGDAYEVVTLADSLAAINSVKEFRPHLVMIDLKMPRKTGFQIAVELSRMPELAGVPIVGMTGFFIETEHTLLMNMCGIRYCLKKPFAPSQAIEEIEKALQEFAHREK